MMPTVAKTAKRIFRMQNDLEYALFSVCPTVYAGAVSYEVRYILTKKGGTPYMQFFLSELGTET